MEWNLATAELLDWQLFNTSRSWLQIKSLIDFFLFRFGLGGFGQVLGSSIFTTKAHHDTSLRLQDLMQSAPTGLLAVGPRAVTDGLHHFESSWKGFLKPTHPFHKLQSNLRGGSILYWNLHENWSLNFYSPLNPAFLKYGEFMSIANSMYANMCYFAFSPTTWNCPCTNDSNQIVLRLTTA